jgi:hypothetical protein
VKKNLLLIFLLFNGAFVYSQGSIEIKAFYGFSGTHLRSNAEIVTGTSVEVDRFREFGMIFSKGIGQKFRLNGGLTYSYAEANLDYNSSYCPSCLTILHNSEFRMLSVPVYAEYSPTDFLFVAAGPVLDFQLSEDNNFNDQSGFGYLVGVGGRVQAQNFTISVFPNYKRHAVIPFEKSTGYKNFLQEFGLQVGVGYRF